jgi:hypothetical protein
MEHRCGLRRVLKAPVILRTRSGLSAEGQVCDISASGALIRSPLPLSLHATVFLQFASARSAKRQRSSVMAEVVRQVEDGFAVEWTEFSPPAVRELVREFEARPAQPMRSKLRPSVA